MPYTQITVPARELKPGDVFESRSTSAVTLSVPRVTTASQDLPLHARVVSVTVWDPNYQENERFIEGWMPITVWRTT